MVSKQTVGMALLLYGVPAVLTVWIGWLAASCDAVIDGDYVDVMIVEKLLSPGRYRVGVPSDE